MIFLKNKNLNRVCFSSIKNNFFEIDPLFPG